MYAADINSRRNYRNFYRGRRPRRNDSEQKQNGGEERNEKQVKFLI